MSSYIILLWLWLYQLVSSAYLGRPYLRNRSHMTCSSGIQCSYETPMKTNLLYIQTYCIPQYTNYTAYRNTACTHSVSHQTIITNMASIAISSQQHNMQGIVSISISNIPHTNISYNVSTCNVYNNSSIGFSCCDTVPSTQAHVRHHVAYDWKKCFTNFTDLSLCTKIFTNTVSPIRCG